jgi:hypothetical protein
MRAGKRVGTLVSDKQGRAVITLEHDAVSDVKRKALVKALEEFLAAENER